MKWPICASSSAPTCRKSRAAWGSTIALDRHFASGTGFRRIVFSQGRERADQCPARSQRAVADRGHGRAAQARDGAKGHVGVFVLKVNPRTAIGSRRGSNRRTCAATTRPEWSKPNRTCRSLLPGRLQRGGRRRCGLDRNRMGTIPRARSCPAQTRDGAAGDRRPAQ